MVFQRCDEGALKDGQIFVLLELLIVEVLWYHTYGDDKDFQIRALLEAYILNEINDTSVANHVYAIVCTLFDRIIKAPFFDALHISKVIVNMLNAHQRIDLLNKIIEYIRNVSAEVDLIGGDDFLVSKSYKVIVLYILSHDALINKDKNCPIFQSMCCFLTSQSEVSKTDFEGGCRKILANLLEEIGEERIIFTVEDLNFKPDDKERVARVEIHEGPTPVGRMLYDVLHDEMRVEYPERFSNSSRATMRLNQRENFDSHVCKNIHGIFNKRCSCNVFFAGDGSIPNRDYIKACKKGLTSRSLNFIKPKDACEFCNADLSGYTSHKKHTDQHNARDCCTICGTQVRVSGDPTHHKEKEGGHIRIDDNLEAAIHCPFCKKYFESSPFQSKEDQLRMHMKTHPIVGRHNRNLTDRCLYLCGLKTPKGPCMAVLDKSNSADHCRKYHYRLKIK